MGDPISQKTLDAFTILALRKKTRPHMYNLTVELPSVQACDCAHPHPLLPRSLKRYMDEDPRPI